MKQEIILEQLKIMGFEPFFIDEGEYMFEYKELKCLLRTDKDNEDFLSISIPIFYDFAEEDRLTVYENANTINSFVRYVKLTIDDNFVSAVYEHRMAANENLDELLEHVIQVLSTTVSAYVQKMRGEKLPYLDYFPEEENTNTDESTYDFDAELESKLEKLLENDD